MIISPSLLAADYLALEQQINELNESAAKWLHYDIMDGHFVPNMSFGPDIVKAVGSKCKLVKDVHLMVNEPLKFCRYFLPCEPDYLTVHFEALDDVGEFLVLCRQHNVKSGIAVKPNTPIEALDKVIDSFDLILVMSVEPGFGNQQFMPQALKKIRYLAHRPHKYLIEVDGGINAETGALCKEAGADVLVAGSYVFKGDIKERIKSLL